jgi:uncharacterized membrane protein YkvA (DUF1232 family)
MPSFTPAQIQKALDAKSEHLTEADLRRIAESSATVLKMIDDFPESWAKARRQANVLLELLEANLKNPKLAWSVLRPAGGALIYLGSPLDLVPDDEEDGFADDAAIISLAIEQLRAQVKAHCEALGRNSAEYLD